MAGKCGPYKKRPKEIELPPGLPELGTPAQIAKYLCTTVNTRARWRYRGDGPTFIKVGHSVRYRWADVLEYLENNTRTPSAPVPNSRPAQMHRPIVNGLDHLDKEFYRFCFNCGHPARNHAMQPYGTPYGVGPCHDENWDTPPGQMTSRTPCDCKEFDEAVSRRRRKPKKYQGAG
jgi:hypothetical protein